MSDGSLSSWFRRSGAARWGACFALAIGFHGAGAAALMARWTDDNALLPNAPAIMIDLAPLAVSPTDVQTDTPPDNVQSKEEIVKDPTPEKPVEEVKAEPEPEKPPEKEQPPDPTPKPDLAVIPPPKVEKPKPKPKKKMASVSRTASSAENRADHAAAPSPGANGNPNAVPSWMSQLFSHLERYKRYPSDGGGDAGIVQLAFSIDRSGSVHGARVVRSSGSSALDHAALALLSRASPLPPPPPEKPGANISISVPIRYKPN
ncbi:TonB family protein [Microbacteriaceae bacterium K1510]|nr:TonB family protein [Microbacteriaceae bacterium K1510]